jgi:hypothetical protein
VIIYTCLEWPSMQTVFMKITDKIRASIKNLNAHSIHAGAFTAYLKRCRMPQWIKPNFLNHLKKRSSNKLWRLKPLHNQGPCVRHLKFQKPKLEHNKYVRTYFTAVYMRSHKMPLSTQRDECANASRREA